jgi:hypothetical protein
MYIKECFRDGDEYLKWFVSLLDKLRTVQSNGAWKDEDRPLLNPFFSFQKSSENLKRGMNTEEAESYWHYLRCRKEYADELFEIRDSLHCFSTDQLACIFGFTYGRKDDDDENEDVAEWSLDENCDFNFPMIVVGNIEAGADRIGSYQSSGICFVSLSDFDGDIG